MNVHGLKLVNNPSKPPFTSYLLYFFNDSIAISTEFSEIQSLLIVHIDD